jgi:hypothetical protein
MHRMIYFHVDFGTNATILICSKKGDGFLVEEINTRWKT